MSASGVMERERWRPWTAGRFLETSARTTVLAVLVGAVYAGLAGAPPAFWSLVGLGGILALPQFRGSRLAEIGDRISPWWYYAWIGTGLFLAALFVRFVADPPIETWTVLWAIIAVNAGFSFPHTGQLVLHALSAGSLAWLLAWAQVPPSGIVAYLGLYAVLAYVAGRVGAQTRDEVQGASASRAEAERVSGLLQTLARMNTLDLGEAGRVVVTALADVGYEMVTFGVVVDGTHLQSVAALGFAPDAGIDEPFPLDAGLTGVAIRERRTVMLDDYSTWEHAVAGRDEVRGCVAVPVEVDGEVRAVLLGATRDVGHPNEDELVVIELLAAQAARVVRSADRYDEEVVLAEQLRQLEALKSDFVTSVSHELRTPLTIIRGAGETLEERAADLTASQRSQLMHRLTANADRLDGLIGTLLDLSRLDAGAVALRREPADLRELVERAVTDLARPLERHRVVLDLPEVEVEVDGSLIAHVLGSLLGNVAKHTPAGTTVTVAATREDDLRVHLVVEDDGPGIREEERRMVVDHFFRGGHSLRRESSGLGLGLSVASAILVEHGTELQVGSSPAGGASFGFTLPVAQRRAVVG